MKSAWALAFVLHAADTAAQSLWTRLWHGQAEVAARHREVASLDALFAEFADRLRWRFVLDPADVAALHPERLRHNALAHVDAALAIDPDEPRTLALAANLRAHRAGEPRRALQLADRALAIDPHGPDRADLLFTRALAALHLGRYEEARDAWQASLVEPLSPPTRAITLGNLADTLLVLRDVRRAIDAYRGAVEADPQNELVWLGLGVALDRAGIDATEVLARAVTVASEMATGRTPGAPFASDALVTSLDRPAVFFEPGYERYYHTALAWEAGAREHDPGGRAPTDGARARSMREAALRAWQAYLVGAPDDDPWRARAERHITRLRLAVTQRARSAP